MGSNKSLEKAIEKIKKVLKEHIPNADVIDVERSRGLPSKIHIIIASEFFKEKNMQKRQDYVWEVLEKNLTSDELLRISLCLILTPDEAREEIAFAK